MKTRIYATPAVKGLIIIIICLLVEKVNFFYMSSLWTDALQVFLTRFYSRLHCLTSSACPGRSRLSFFVLRSHSLRVESADPEQSSLLSALQATWWTRWTWPRREAKNLKHDQSFLSHQKDSTGHCDTCVVVVFLWYTERWEDNIWSILFLWEWVITSVFTAVMYHRKQNTRV